MKKLNVLFAAALALALGAGLFVSCDAGGDNTEELLANIRAMEQERRTAILNGPSLSMSQGAFSTRGDIEEDVARKFGQDGEKHVVLTLTAYPADGYVFNIEGLTVTYDGNAVTPVAHPTKPNVFTITVPAGTKEVELTGTADTFTNPLA